MRFRMIVGLAAAASSMSAVSAKDLPRGPAPPRTTGCEWAGPGFAKVEGSDTCVRVGGSVRVEFSASSARGSSYAPNPGQ